MLACPDGGRERVTIGSGSALVIRSAFTSRSAVSALGIAAAALSVSACSTIGYYGHLAHGEYAILATREPIARVIDDPKTEPALRVRLELADQARRFASDHLGLPRNGSYTEYADLHRPYAMWNVFAAPEFSLAPVEQCFPIAGCVAYRGYYDH